MRSTAFFTALTLGLTLIPGLSAITTSYDTSYDDGSRSLATVACSDGPNGLISRGYTTFGSLPRFPHIGGAPAVTGWNSAGCGTCWTLSYTNATNVTKNVTILAIDVATPDFNIALSAMNELTAGQASFLGRVPVTAVQVNASACGL